MKNNLLITALIIACITRQSTSYAQAPNWLWAKSAGGTAIDHGQNIAVDASGNSYVTGLFTSTSITFGTTTLTNAGGSSGNSAIFITKYDAGGNVIWAKSAGGSNSGEAFGIAIDDSGNSYITGNFWGSTFTVGAITLTSVGYEDMFIAKCDASGNFVWAKSAGSNNYDDAKSIAVDNNGNSLVAGFFQGSSITFGSTTLTNAGGGSGTSDLFIAKYDANGNLIWAKSEGGIRSEQGSGIAIDSNDNSYVTGSFSGTTITVGTTTLTNAGALGTADVFIAKYDAGGNVIWAKSAGGINNDDASSIAVDDSGNSYVAGGFLSSSISFGSTTLSNAGVGSGDIFIAKYDTNGNTLWAKSTGGSYHELASHIAIDASGNSYVTGSFASSSITCGSTTITNAGNFDIYIVKYDVSGNVVWAKSAGDSNEDNGKGIAVDGTGNIYATGYFQSSSISFGTTILNNAGYKNLYVAKIASTVTSVAEMNIGKNAIIYPNPASNELTISNLKFPQYIEIYNELGLCVINQVPLPNSEKQIIDVSSLPSGIYFIKVNCGENIYSKKIIVTMK